MTDLADIIAMMQSTRAEQDAQFGLLMQELTAIRQQIQLLEMAITGKHIAGRTAVSKKQRDERD
jgi:hypothetical protein